MDQEVTIEAKDILTRLAKLQASIDYIREHIEDITLTAEGLESIEEARGP